MIVIAGERQFLKVLLPREWYRILLHTVNEIIAFCFQTDVLSTPINVRFSDITQTSAVVSKIGCGFAKRLGGVVSASAVPAVQICAIYSISSLLALGIVDKASR